MPAKQLKGPSQGMRMRIDTKSITGVRASSINDDQNGQISTQRSEKKPFSFEDMDTDGEKDPLNNLDPQGRSIRASRGRNPQWLPGFVDSSTLVINSSDGEDDYVLKRNYNNAFDSEVDEPHTIASPEMNTMNTPSTPPLSPLPPAVAPFAAEVPLIIGANPFAGISRERWQPLKITVNLPEGHQGGVVINVDYHSIMTSMQRLLPDGDGNDTEPLVKAETELPEPAVKPLDILIDVPEGHEGRAVSNIDFDRIIASIHPLTTTTYLDWPTRSHGPPLSTSLTVVHEPRLPPRTPSVRDAGGLGFLDLSGEIRNKVYRLVMKGEPVYFIDGTNFEHSASLLRTCKQVYEECRPILYGDNEFIFERDPQRSSLKFWSPDRTEIGYGNARRFLEMIGRVNIGLIRLVGISFDDALPSTAPRKDHEERRYVNDFNCLYMLKLLARHGNLHKVTIGLYGRRKLCQQKDCGFIKDLAHIPADVVVFKHPRYLNNHRFQYLDVSKNSDRVKEIIREGMHVSKRRKREALAEGWQR